MKLTGKKLKFCHYYGHHQNGALAARQAGFTIKNADATASNLLKIPMIRELIDELIADRMARLEITGEKILQELAKIAFTDTTQIQGLDAGRLTQEDFDKLTPEQRACVASVKQTKEGVEVKFYDKIAALTKLGQNQKLFTDIQEQKHSFNKMGEVKALDDKGQEVELVFNIGREPDEITEH